VATERKWARNFIFPRAVGSTAPCRSRLGTERFVINETFAIQQMFVIR